VKSLGDTLTDGQQRFARSDEEWPHPDRDLFTVVENVKPHVLIGTSKKGRAFKKEIIFEMAKHVERPIVFPPSRPTKLHEANPNDLYEWTKGHVLVTTGSPFPAVKYADREYEIGKKSRHPSEKQIHVLNPDVLAQCNNSVCFPGIGLGAVLSQSRLVTNKIVVVAVETLKERSSSKGCQSTIAS
jgi:malate dehydrogenase (oxaloacetate-decarboxylating)